MHINPSQFQVHPSSGVPIYRQIIDQVQAMVIGGRLEGGRMLPSVRETATALGVNPMTISKAYARLEADGIVERVRGKGMMVCRQAVDGPLTQRVATLRQVAEPVVVRGRQLGLSNKQILDLVRDILQEYPP